MRRVGAALLVLLIAGCAGSGGQAAIRTPGSTLSASPLAPRPTQQKAVPAEKNPPGDIPDGLGSVLYRNVTAGYSFTHPEGWAQTNDGSAVLFTDKLNGVHVSQGSETTPPTPASAKQRDVPALRGSQAAFELRGVAAVKLPAGTGVRIIYRRNSAPDPVTGRQYRDEVERYEIVARGREVVMELFGPVGADNVDAYQTMSQSLRFV